MHLALPAPEDDSEIEPWGWIVLRAVETGTRHGMPTWDTEDHWPCECCWCGPRIDESGMWAHNAADGREDYEIHGRKRH